LTSAVEAAPRTIPKVWRLLIPIVEHELVLDAYPFIAQVIAASRRARSLADHIAVQERLAGAAREIRDVHGETRQRERELRDEMKAAVGDRDRLAQLNDEGSANDARRAANQRRLLALRMVQDGVLWRLFHFDRQAIGVLGLGQQVGYPSAAFDNEYAFAHDEWDAGRLAIFCDLSSCSTGDLITADPATGELAVVEVTEGRKNTPRKIRQLGRIQQKLDFLASGHSTELAPDGAPLISAAERPRLKTHQSNLGDLLAIARRDVAAYGRAGEHLYVEALDTRAVKIEHLQPDVVARFDRRRERAAPQWTNRRTYEWDSMHRLHRDQTGSASTTAPYSIFPVDEGTAAALCLGYVTFRTVLDVDYLIANLERRGWQVEIVEQPTIYMTVMRVTGRLTQVIGVNPMQMEQFVVELLSVGAFARSIDGALRQAHARPASAAATHVTWAYSDEARVWV
jgi:hypothetical protein